ncbi:MULTISPECIES: type 4a pilus biogenesis protein PilO [unclassified Moraxella]|uniref:type 4a pilus biogenesis protein PilO n=1 Tax=unclassified Moraxella TaxID=2685852 RepID=UPI002B410EA2|nr:MULTISPECIES: type 4a pilus biogenesis protein PilO [unclassified Moraxella]
MNHQLPDDRPDFDKFRQTWRQLGELTVDNFGVAPAWLRVLVLVMLAVFIALFGWLLFIKPIMLERHSLVVQENTLIAQYAQKYTKAGQLKAVELQTQALHHELTDITEQLPNAFDMNSLIEQIHALAIRSGVQVADVKTGVQSESPMFFERRVSLVFIGNYHQLGQMLAELSLLPIPLTFHDFEMTKLTQHQAVSEIRLSIQAKTYRAKSKKELEKRADNTNDAN